jgi:inosose dehydratase
VRVAVSPILWHNEDVPGLMPPIDADTLVREIAEAGFDATEYSSLFPCEPPMVRRLLEPHAMRLVSAYVPLHLPGGDVAEQVRVAIARARFVAEAGGEVLVAALDYDERRKCVAGSVGESDPTLDEGGWRQLAAALHEIGLACRALGVTLVFHNEAGTFIETEGEFAELADRIDPALVSLCLDIGYLTVGGGDTVESFRSHRDSIKHVHVKDADRGVSTAGGGVSTRS